MKVFAIILGVLMAICGVSCICTPLMTFLEAGYFLVILLLVYGIGAIIRAVMEKKYGIDFLFGILSVILGIVIMVVPGLKLATDGMLVYIMASWFLLQGVVGIFLAFKRKKADQGKGWIWTLILGILGVLIGIYSLVHPMVMAFTFGILVGVYFMESGISMIVMACSAPSEPSE
ncbi:MAG: hypothetical protein HFH41_11325 [Lachnospiraceae bacterium]|nr:hypothetical protein [Lachnospiraceae bacterium]